jgi:hypothetical protein
MVILVLCFYIFKFSSLGLLMLFKAFHLDREDRFYNRSGITIVRDAGPDFIMNT